MQNVSLKKNYNAKRYLQKKDFLTLTILYFYFFVTQSIPTHCTRIFLLQSMLIE